MQPAQLEAALELPEVPPDTLEEPALALLEDGAAEDPPEAELEPPPLETWEELPGREDIMEEDQPTCEDETVPEPDPADVALAPEEEEEGTPPLEDEDGSGPPVVDGTQAAPDTATSAATLHTPRRNIRFRRIWCLLRGHPCGVPWTRGVMPVRAPRRSTRVLV